MRPDRHPGEISERRRISRHDDSAGCKSGGRDDQVVRPAGSPLTSGGRQQEGVRPGDRQVVVDDRDVGRDVVDEALPSVSVSCGRKLYADKKLGDGDRGNGDVVLVADGLIDRGPGAFEIDEEGGVEEEPCQGRRSISSSSRTDATSRANAASGR